MVHALKRLLGEPLVHFLLAGVVIFLVAMFFGDRSGEDYGRDDGVRGVAGRIGDGPTSSVGSEGDRRIEIREEDLRIFVASKTRSEGDADFDRRFDALPKSEIDRWVGLFAREEALVREARRLGLDRDDDLIRRRLVQKVEFIALGALESGLTPEEGDLEDFYATRRDDYRAPTIVSFSHVFLRKRASDAKGTERDRAEALVDTLNQDAVTPDQALERGERFLYNRNYIDRTEEEVVSHFGAAAAAGILALPPGEGKWRGPIRSEHGEHAVWMIRQQPSRFPALHEIRDRVKEDWLRAKRETELDLAVAKIVDAYSVEVIR